MQVMFMDICHHFADAFPGDEGRWHFYRLIWVEYGLRALFGLLLLAAMLIWVFQKNLQESLFLDGSKPRYIGETARLNPFDMTTNKRRVFSPKEKCLRFFFTFMSLFHRADVRSDFGIPQRLDYIRDDLLTPRALLSIVADFLTRKSLNLGWWLFRRQFSKGSCLFGELPEVHHLWNVSEYKILQFQILRLHTIDHLLSSLLRDLWRTAVAGTDAMVSAFVQTERLWLKCKPNLLDALKVFKSVCWRYLMLKGFLFAKPVSLVLLRLFAWFDISWCKLIIHLLWEWLGQSKDLAFEAGAKGSRVSCLLFRLNGPGSFNN